MMARLVTATGRVAAGAPGGRLRPTLLGCFSPSSSVLCVLVRIVKVSQDWNDLNAKTYNNNFIYFSAE